MCRREFAVAAEATRTCAVLLHASHSFFFWPNRRTHYIWLHLQLRGHLVQLDFSCDFIWWLTATQSTRRNGTCAVRAHFMCVCRWASDIFNCFGSAVWTTTREQETAFHDGEIRRRIVCVRLGSRLRFFSSFFYFAMETCIPLFVLFSLVPRWHAIAISALCSFIGTESSRRIITWRFVFSQRPRHHFVSYRRSQFARFPNEKPIDTWAHDRAERARAQQPIEID